MNRKRIDYQWLVVSLIGSVLINLIMLPMFAVTADPVELTDSTDPLPPRGPTPTPPAVPGSPPEEPAVQESTAVEGARIQLHLKYGDNWDWDSSSWQDLWVEIHWTDSQDWFVVNGWRGNLDGIEQKTAGDWISQKEWWVSNKDLNSGPFRWVVYEREGGDILAISGPFRLPAISGQTTIIDVMVGE